MTFLEVAEKVVREENRPLTPEEMWQVVRAKGFDTEVGSQGKTPWASIAAQLYVGIKNNPASIWMRVGKRPTRFFLRELNLGNQYSASTVVAEKKSAEVVTSNNGFLEKDLHPHLAYFAFHNLKAYCKTINHSRSRKDEFGEWVHPDVVGVYYPLEDWEQEVVALSGIVKGVALKLFSFEIKRQLSFSNLREAFFQSVSNSSWANEGYLVAADVSLDEEFQSELQRLSTSFGIGIIELTIDDPDSSRIVYPARQREYIDWETVNKLTINRDFMELIDRIRRDMTSNEIRKEKYDSVLDAAACMRKTGQ